jgi:hypothetical protein
MATEAQINANRATQKPPPDPNPPKAKKNPPPTPPNSASSPSITAFNPTNRKPTTTSATPSGKTSPHPAPSRKSPPLNSPATPGVSAAAPPRKPDSAPGPTSFKLRQQEIGQRPAHGRPRHLRRVPACPKCVAQPGNSKKLVSRGAFRQAEPPALPSFSCGARGGLLLRTGVCAPGDRPGPAPRELYLRSKTPAASSAPQSS